MTEKTRLNLDKAIGDLIESFVEFDKNTVMHLKIGLEAIHNAQKHREPAQKANLYAVCDYGSLHRLLESNGIPYHEFAQIPELLAIENREKQHFRGLSKPLQEAIAHIMAKANSDYDVPTTGMVAVMFNMVSDKVKNALVAGQAGERTLRAIERATTVSQFTTRKEIALRDTLYDYGNKHRLARPYIGAIWNEPDYLISAKATHHLADLFESSLKLFPAARTFESTAKSMQGFNKLAACIFTHASVNLDMAQAEKAASEIKELAKRFGGYGHEKSEAIDACKIVDDGMRHLRKSLRMEGIISEQESQDYEELVNRRIEQIRKMELV